MNQRKIRPSTVINQETDITQRLITRYEALLDDPMALIDEGWRFVDRTHDLELAIFLGILLGHLATFADAAEQCAVRARCAEELRCSPNPPPPVKSAF